MADADIRTNTLPRRSVSTGLTIISFDETGGFVGLDPVGTYPSLSAIGAAGSADLTAGLATKQSLADKGLANGYAGLDADGKVPAANLPAITSGGSVGVSDAIPQAPAATGAAGSASLASRADHVHPLPTLTQLGAAPVVHTHSIAAITDLSNQLSLRELLANKGAPNGYAPLGGDGKVPAANLPAGISQADLSTKADAAQTTAALALKANTTDVQTSLDLKANLNDPRIVSAVQPNQAAVVETFSGSFGISASDANKVKYCTSTTDVTMTLNSQVKGFTIRFIQTAAGKIVFAAAAGQSVLSFSNLLSTAGAGADVTATVYEVGQWHLSGRLV